MSYDVWLEVDTGGPERAALNVLDVNYTSNVSPMWTMALGANLGDLIEENEKEGRTAGRLVGLLSDAVEKMRAEPAAFQAMNPENGWGRYEGALEFLDKIRAACEAHPLAYLRVSR